MDVTVAICTWNRAPLLEKTLARLRDLEVPPDVRWEVVVVDNASTDDTARVIEKSADGLPLRCVREREQGLSRARNRAIEVASGDLICWTDDDVLVDPAWVARYARASRERPDASFFGGPILPWFESEPPRWVAAGIDEIGSAFALRDLGPLPIALSQTRLPFGANFAVRASVQRRFPFDAELGRVGGRLLSGEETDAMLRMLAAGLTGAWLPDARVHHFVPADRMRVDYVRRFYRGVGASWSRTTHARARGRRLLCAAKIARRAVLHPFLPRDSAAWCRSLRDLEANWGELTGKSDPAG
jgi:glycosyltransferase involved in cell wall biosynthesis